MRESADVERKRQADGLGPRVTAVLCQFVEKKNTKYKSSHLRREKRDGTGPAGVENTRDNVRNQSWGTEMPAPFEFKISHGLQNTSKAAIVGQNTGLHAFFSLVEQLEIHRGWSSIVGSFVMCSTIP